MRFRVVAGRDPPRRFQRSFKINCRGEVARTQASLERRPELLDAKNERILDWELLQLNKTIDARFGEINWDNVFWDKAIKQTMIATMLSAGWHLGKFRMISGAVHDLTDNLAHMDQLRKTFREEGTRGVAKRFLTNRIVFAAQYMFATGLKNAVITFLLGGASAAASLALRDLIYPRIGKDANGRDKRLNMPFWTKDYYNIYSDL